MPLTELLVNGNLQIYPEIAGREYFRILLRRDSLVFQAGAFIGLIPINDRVAIDVRPRVPITNLEHMLHVTEQPLSEIEHHTRSYETDYRSLPSLLYVYTRYLTKLVKLIEARGLFREYKNAPAETSCPRGRILVTRTLTRHRSRGEEHKVSASWFEQSLDNAINRCIKYALWYLAQRYLGIKRTGAVRGQLRKLNQAYQVFRGVSLDLSRQFLQDRLVKDPADLPDIRYYYRQAVRLASAIMRDSGIVFNGRRDDVLMSSLVLKMEDIFETYLRTVLTREIEVRAAHLAVLDGNKEGAGGARKLLYDQEPSPLASPDIVVVGSGGKGAAIIRPVVLEIKYKRIPKSPDRDALNQAISYGASYRSNHVILVHPRLENCDHGLASLGSIGHMKLSKYAYDLAAMPIGAEERLFCAEIINVMGERE